MREGSDPSEVTVQLPQILADLAGGEREVAVSGDTLRAALDDLVQRRRALGLHLFDEAGLLRRHVLCFCNDTHARKELDVPVSPGDTITILHSVSGG